MKIIKIKDEYITLGQFLKFAGCVSSGIDAKIVIKDGLVLVNGEVESRRGKKLRRDDMIEFDGETFVIG
ncbi:S4 domain-containing protein YaaA [Thomasclavelia saccharogumia]|uniref:S4 domain-containing protein YaaA n=1 Tax=Thomasclavelia saccharogumia TaxID=341225 RepID=UPI00047CEBAC|nr:S4 domain-containing protein YaaA [Thomasclavelia saccharogumia]